jgi:hypothetical protein
MDPITQRDNALEEELVAHQSLDRKNEEKV